MKHTLLIIVFIVSTFTACGQQITANTYFTWENFVDGFGRENRGGLKDENGDYKGAIADYEAVLKLEKLEAEEKQQAYFNSGNTYFNLKDKNAACENWYKALVNGAEYAKERINEHCN